MKEKAEDTEEVEHCVSDKILSPAHKRFISLSPLITLSNPAVPTCVFVHVSVCYVYIYIERETKEENNSHYTAGHQQTYGISTP